MTNRFLLKIEHMADDHEKYFRDSSAEIANRNLRLLKIISIIIFIFTACFIIFTPVLIPKWHVSNPYIFLLLVSFTFIIVSHIASKQKISENAVTVLCILFCTLVLLLFIIIDAVINSETPASFFPIVAVVLYVVFTFRYRFIISMCAILQIIYIMLLSHFEFGLIRQYDIYNAIVSFVISMTVAIIITITRVEDNTMKQKYKKLSKIDYLTSIYNKNACEGEVMKYLRDRTVDNICALIVFDIDNFKSANDVYGHTVGDRILEDFSRYLLDVFGGNNIVGRIGGDEFMVLMTDIDDESVVSIKCRDFQNKIKSINYIEDYTVRCSLGAAILKNYPCGYIQLFQVADDALYEAKNSGKNRMILRRFDPSKNGSDIKPAIVIIDADSVEKKNLCDILRPHYEIRSASDETDAIAALEYLKERITAAIIDFHTTELDQYHILNYIKNDYANQQVPVIAVISEDTESDQILKLGVTEVITRPIDDTVLKSRLQSIIINKIKK